MAQHYNSWYLVFGNISRVLLLGVGLLGARRYRQLPPELRYLVGLAWFGLGMELTSELVARWHGTNVVLQTVDAAGELWLLSLVYGRALKSPLFTQWRPWVAGSFVGYAVLDAAFSFNEVRFKPVLLVLDCVLVLGMVALYFRKLLNELPVMRMERTSLFWVSSGLLLHFLGKLQIALFSNYMYEHYSRQLNLNIWSIHVFLLIILYCCYFWALWISPRK